MDCLRVSTRSAAQSSQVRGTALGLRGAQIWRFTTGRLSPRRKRTAVVHDVGIANDKLVRTGAVDDASTASVDLAGRHCGPRPLP